MPAFSSKSRGSNPLLNSVRRHPFAMFGLPFLSLVVVSSYALQTFTQTRYDLNDQKVQAVSKEEELGMSKDRKKVDIREEYYRLNGPASSISSNDEALDASLSSAPTAPKKKEFFNTVAQDEYEPIRVPRPAGVPEWGGMRGEEAPVKGQRKEDRWV